MEINVIKKMLLAGSKNILENAPPQEFVLRNCRGFTFDRTTIDP